MNCWRVNLRSASWTYRSGASIFSNALLSMATRALPQGHTESPFWLRRDLRSANFVRRVRRAL